MISDTSAATGAEETETASNTDEKVTAEKGGEASVKDTSESPKGGSDKGKSESSDPSGKGSDAELPDKPEVPVTTTNPSSQKGGAKDLPKSPGNGPTVPLF